MKRLQVTRDPWAAGREIPPLSAPCVPENTRISLILFKKYSKLSRKVLIIPQACRVSE